MVSLATKHNDADASLGWNERLGFGSAQFGMNMINGILGSFLTIYFTNCAFLNATIISSIIAVSKLFDGVSDIVVGRLVDNTKSKLGKGRSWLLRMCIPFAVTTLLLFWVPSGMPEMLKYVYVFLMYNAVSTVCFTSMAVPYFSMISLVTRNPYERGMLGNIQQIFSTLGNIAVNALFVGCLTTFTSDPTAQNIYTQRGFTITMIIVCSIMVACSILCVLCTKERVTETKEEVKVAQPKEKTPLIPTLKALFTNKYWVMMVFAMFVVFFVIIFSGVGATFYCQYVFYDMSKFNLMSNSTSIAQFAIMFATPVFMKKFGKRAIYTAGMGISLIGYLGFGLLGDNLVMMVLFNVFKGIGLGLSGGMALGIVADAITYGNLKSGIDTVGMGNAGVSAAQKIGMGVGTALFGFVLDGSGFDPTLDAQGIHQAASVSNAITAVYTWVPLVLTAIVFVMMLFAFNLEKDLKELQAKQG